MNKTLRSLLVLLLIVLVAGSGTLFLVAATHPSASYDPKKVKLDVKLITRDQILTCGYKVYADSSQNYWVAKTIIKNTGKIPVYDFKINYRVKDFSGWTSGEYYPVISPGETVRDFCWPSLEGDKVSQITTKTPVEIIMKYQYRGMDSPIEDTDKIFLLGRNDYVCTSLKEDEIVTFSDTRDNYPFLSTFVTPNEPTTKAFANMVASGFPTVTDDEAAYGAFLKCFDVLRAHGVKYIQEPAVFWSGKVGQYVQYPKDTIERKSGTCMDLAICYVALMEAVGIRSFIANIKGHVMPVIELPESGEKLAIESTFIDKDFALANYPDLGLSPNVTAEECVPIANESIMDSADKGELIMVDLEYWWDVGMVPPW